MYKNLYKIFIVQKFESLKLVGWFGWERIMSKFVAQVVVEI